MPCPRCQGSGEQAGARALSGGSVLPQGLLGVWQLQLRHPGLTATATLTSEGLGPCPSSLILGF